MNSTPLIFYPTDYRKIFTHLTSDAGAYSRYERMKKILNKARHQFITIEEIADIEGIPVAEIVQRLK